MSSPLPGVLRTPDERFAGLPGYPWAPHYVDSLPGFEGLRMHYLDEGDPHAEVTFLCLHGQPTWSYLYRRMLPAFLATGARVVAPDLFGFGRSDKPVDESWYTFSRHRAALLAFVRHLDLHGITLVVQDWGGLLGLTLPMAEPARYQRLIAMNTMLATGLKPLGEGFHGWRAWVNANPDFAVGRLLKRYCPNLTDAEAAAYDAPFPDLTYKAGARRFPNLVCDSPDADGAAVSREALQWWRHEWLGRSFMAIGLQDVVIPPAAMQWLQRQIRGCPPPMTLADSNHFVQEQGEAVAQAALAHFAGATHG